MASRLFGAKNSSLAAGRRAGTAVSAAAFGWSPTKGSIPCSTFATTPNTRQNAATTAKVQTATAKTARTQPSKYRSEHRSLTPKPTNCFLISPSRASDIWRQRAARAVGAIRILLHRRARHRNSITMDGPAGCANYSSS